MLTSTIVIMLVPQDLNYIFQELIIYFRETNKASFQVVRLRI